MKLGDIVVIDAKDHEKVQMGIMPDSMSEFIWLKAGTVCMIVGFKKVSETTREVPVILTPKGVFWINAARIKKVQASEPAD